MENKNFQQTLAEREQEVIKIQKQMEKERKQGEQWINGNKAPEIKIDRNSSVKIDVEKKVTFNMNNTNLYVKLNYSDTGEKKEIIFNLSSNFKLTTLDNKQKIPNSFILNNAVVFSGT